MITLFSPIGKQSYLGSFPELYSIDEFKIIPNAMQMVFIWYFANPSSPIIELNEYDRVHYAIDIVFEDKMSQDMYDKYMDLQFDDNMKNAIKRMSQFRIEERVRAYRIIKDIIKNFIGDDQNFITWADFVKGKSKIIKHFPKLQQIEKEKFGLEPIEAIDLYVLKEQSYDNIMLQAINQTLNDYERIIKPEFFINQRGDRNFLQYVDASIEVINNIHDNINSLEKGIQQKTKITNQEKSILVEWHKSKSVLL